MEKQIQRLSGVLTIEAKNDTYYIDQVEDEGCKGGFVFRVTSMKGLDTYGNGYYISSIEKAISYVKNSIKNN